MGDSATVVSSIIYLFAPIYIVLSPLRPNRTRMHCFGRDCVLVIWPVPQLSDASQAYIGKLGAAVFWGQWPGELGSS